MSSYHIPVLLKEAVDALYVHKGDWYIDATAGGGGHIQEILNRGGRVIAIDQDRDAIEELTHRFAGNEEVIIVHSNFKNLTKICNNVGIDQVSGVLFDLGVSSHQIGASGRGFSMRYDEPLDMRMGEDTDVTAAELINEYPSDQLREIFERLGEEVHAQKIADAIAEHRKGRRFRTTKDLVDVIESLHLPSGEIHPATKVFQALRIEVNQELDVIKEALEAAIECIQTNGKIAVISFHSLEDRIVKRKFQEWQRKGLGQIGTKKPVQASDFEVEKNRRSRSAKLRYFEKI